MKENLSPFTLFIKLFVHFLTLLLLSKMRFWQPGFMLLVSAAGHKVLMGGAIWPWGGRKGSTCTHPLLILPSLGRSWPYMLAAFCSCCRFERRLTNPRGAGDANSRRLGFFFFFLFSFLVAASSWALNAAKARPCSYYPHQKWRLGLLSHSWHPSSMSVPSDSVKPWHELFCIVTVNPSP